MAAPFLPLYARLAVERLDADASLRTRTQLDALLDDYAETYGIQCDPDTRAEALHRCMLKFFDFDCHA